MTPDLRRAAMRAVLAPSVHNTQPWRFVVGTRSLDLFADGGRRLHATDPDARQLVISCGAALLGARLSLAGVGIPVEVVLLPDPADTDHLAHIRVLDGPLRPSPADAALDRAADDRHTNRRPFGPSLVPDAVVTVLQEAAEAEGAFLRPLIGDADRAVVAALTGEAEALLFGDPGYRAELRDWAGRPGEHPDGIPVAAIPAAGRVADRLPIRGFDQRGTGGSPPARPPRRTRACWCCAPTPTTGSAGCAPARRCSGCCSRSRGRTSSPGCSPSSPRCTGCGRRCGRRWTWSVTPSCWSGWATHSGHPRRRDGRSRRS